MLPGLPLPPRSAWLWPPSTRQDKVLTELTCLEEVVGPLSHQALEFSSPKKWVGEKQEGVLSKAVL